MRRISANGFSSWPTVRASSANGASKNEIRQGNPKKRLENSAIMWPTITATDSAVSSARPPEKMIRKDGRNVLRTPSLAETVMQPNDFPYTKQDLQARKAGKDYKTAKVHWPTPRAQEPGSTSATHGCGLGGDSATLANAPRKRKRRKTKKLPEAHERQNRQSAQLSHGADQSMANTAQPGLERQLRHETQKDGADISFRDRLSTVATSTW